MIKTKVIVSAFAVLAVFVAPVAAATLKFDFGDGTQVTSGNYNNILVNPINDPSLNLANAIDTSGTSTGIGLVTSGFYTGSNTSGTTAPGGAAAATFDPQATRDNAFGHTGAWGGNPRSFACHARFFRPQPRPDVRLHFRRISHGR